jgi:hypothetical protein
MKRGWAKKRRRALGATEWVIVCAGIFLICVVMVGVMGMRVSEDMDATASEVANPNALTERFK